MVETAEPQEEQVSFPVQSNTLPPYHKEQQQGQGGEEDAAKGDPDGGDLDPLGEQAGQPKQQDGKIDGKQSSSIQGGNGPPLC